MSSIGKKRAPKSGTSTNKISLNKIPSFRYKRNKIEEIGGYIYCNDKQHVLFINNKKEEFNGYDICKRDSCSIKLNEMDTNNFYIDIYDNVRLNSNSQIKFKLGSREKYKIIINKDSVIDDRTTINESTYLSNNCKIGENCNISKSHIGFNTILDENITIKNDIPDMLGTFDVKVNGDDYDYSDKLNDIVNEKKYSVIIGSDTNINTNGNKLIIKGPVIIENNVDLNISNNCTIGPYVILKKNFSDSIGSDISGTDSNNFNLNEILINKSNLTNNNILIKNSDNSDNSDRHDNSNKKSKSKDKSKDSKSNKNNSVGKEVKKDLENVKSKVDEMIQELSRSENESYQRILQNVDDCLSKLKILESPLQGFKVNKDSSLLGEFDWVIKDMKKKVKDKQLFTDTKKIYKMLSKEKSVMKKYSLDVSEKDILKSIQNIIDNNNDEEYIQNNEKKFLNYLNNPNNQPIIYSSFKKYYKKKFGSTFNEETDKPKKDLFYKYCKLLGSIRLRTIKNTKYIELYSTVKCRDKPQTNKKKKYKQSDNKS